MLKRPRRTSSTQVIVSPRGIPRTLGSALHLARMRGRYTSSNREIKYCDIAYNGYAMRIYSTPPTGIVLNIPVQGAAPYNRIGSKVMNKSIRIKGFINNAATGLQDIARILVVYDRQPNGAVPSWATVIQATTSAGAQSNTALDGINMDNRERFKVLIDEQVLLPAVTDAGGLGVLTNAAPFDTSGPANKFNFDRFVQLRGLETHYKASAGAVGDIATGGLFIFATTMVTDNAWSINFTARLRYDDL